MVRLHGQRFKVFLISPVGSDYLNRRVGLVLRVDGNVVECFEDCLVINSSGKSFFGIDESAALDSSMV